MNHNIKKAPKFWYFPFVMLLYYTPVNAESGCLISSTNTVYQTQESPLVNAILRLLLGGNPSYRFNSGVSLNPNFCSWTPAPTGPVNCGVCTEYIIEVEILIPVVKGCQPGKLLQGHVGNYTMVQCDLDDYSWALGASAAALGLIVIRKRKFF